MCSWDEEDGCTILERTALLSSAQKRGEEILDISQLNFQILSICSVCEHSGVNILTDTISHLSERVGTRECLDNWNVRITKTILFECKADYFPFNAQLNIVVIGVQITEGLDNWSLYKWLPTVHTFHNLIIHHCILSKETNYHTTARICLNHVDQIIEIALFPGLIQFSTACSLHMGRA